MTLAIGVAAAVAVACMAVMTYVHGPAMRRRGAGIVPFEKAGTWARAEEILADWGDEGAAAARGSIAVDWVFVAAYVAFAVLVGAHRGGLAWVPAVAVAVAGACDAGENAAMLRMLARDRSRDWPALAKRLATVKFALVYLGLAGSVLAFVLG